jgi:hypothetical protein
MKNFVPFVTLALLAAPAIAQDTEAPGLSLTERGALMFMEGIPKEMEPAIEDLSELSEQMGPAMRNFAEEMGPKLTELLADVEDWAAYGAPEVLPNGDIIIRRKEVLPEIGPEVAPEMPQGPAPQVDL